MMDFVMLSLIIFFKRYRAEKVPATNVFLNRSINIYQTWFFINTKPSPGFSPGGGVVFFT